MAPMRRYPSNAERQRAYRQRQAENRTRLLPRLTPDASVQQALDAMKADARQTFILAAVRHYLDCPQRHATPRGALTSAERRAARDPFQALR